MKILKVLTLISILSIPFNSYSGDTVGVIRNEKGQITGKLREGNNKIEYLNKNGFVQGWVDTRTGRTFNKSGFQTGSIKRK